MLLWGFRAVCRLFHPFATSLPASALEALSRLNQAFSGGAWIATIRITMTALNTGLTAEGTPRYCTWWW